jgi:hypothetical protein
MDGKRGDPFVFRSTAQRSGDVEGNGGAKRRTCGLSKKGRSHSEKCCFITVNSVRLCSLDGVCRST